jgi:hypothetical protein
VLSRIWWLGAQSQHSDFISIYWIKALFPAGFCLAARSRDMAHLASKARVLACQNASRIAGIISICQNFAVAAF